MVVSFRGSPGSRGNPLPIAAGRNNKGIATSLTLLAMTNYSRLRRGGSKPPPYDSDRSLPLQTEIINPRTKKQTCVNTSALSEKYYQVKIT